MHATNVEITNTTNDRVRADIRQLLARLGEGKRFTDHEDVFERGVVRSMNLLEVIGHLEDAYHLRIDQRDVYDGHLRSVDRLVALVIARCGEG